MPWHALSVNDMNTPICDFVQKYASSGTVRLHMPGHKGETFLGAEPLDITEIEGADSLYEAGGIISESENNASAIFGFRTLYSAEGSSQCIRAMLYLISLYANRQGRKALIAAGRNAHKAFLTAAAMLDTKVEWLYPQNPVSYLSCNLTADELESYLQIATEKPMAVYITSPDYLGAVADIKNIAEVCHRHGVLLAVDNAHGAYLKFLPESMHPIDLGADICCDSAHKTLPVLTGGAYLHLSSHMQETVGAQAKNAMMMFGSTSPSYLILQSLDKANVYMTDYPARLKKMLPEIERVKEKLCVQGYSLYGNEPLKLTVYAKAYGYTGIQLSEILRRHKIEAEFADPDYVVLMLSVEINSEMLSQLQQVLCQIRPQAPVAEKSPVFTRARRIMTIREAMLSDCEYLPAKDCLGRVLAVPTVGCPPAVPILVCGEQIDENAVSCFEYYGIDNCCVVK